MTNRATPHGPEGSASPVDEQQRSARDEYHALLDRFRPHRQGYGRELTFPGVKAQPMTYALVVMAEVRRYVAMPTDDGLRRIRSAVAWLLRNSDLDGDGQPGWGLPDEWDAFGDGVGAAGATNPAHHPYTITTALALHGLTDASALDTWTDRERDAISRVVGATARRWSRDVFTASGEGGHFWYSPFAGDAAFCPNVSAMMAGALRHALGHFGSRGAAWAEDPALRERTDQAATEIVARVQWQDGAPFWSYIEDWPRPRPNDAVHHAYVVWGLERYARSGGAIRLPCGPAQVQRSLDAFVLDDVLVDLPPVGAPPTARRLPPMRLWGAGMVLACRAWTGDHAAAQAWYRRVRAAFGPPSAVTVLPAGATTDRRFYARHAAHLLLGLAELAYPDRSPADSR